MKYELNAKSSGNEPYQVLFTFHEDKLTITCNCQAGVFNKLCKHKLALLNGNVALTSDFRTTSLSEICVLEMIRKDAWKWEKTQNIHGQIQGQDGG